MTHILQRKASLVGLLTFLLTVGALAPAMAQAPAQNLVHEQVRLTADRAVYQAGQELVVSLDAIAGSASYTWFIYVQDQESGDRRYYPDFVDGQVTDVLGNTSNFLAFPVPTLTDFEILGPNGFDGNRVLPSGVSLGAGIDDPGRYAIVLELRDAAGSRVLFTARTDFSFVSSVVTVAGNITTPTTWTPDKAYLLSGAVFVVSPATLTIERGTYVLGESATNGTLIVAQGAKLNVMGTWGSPVIMTSDQPVGQRARADWGGLILNGRAPLNTAGGTALGEGDTGTYGGSNAADSSGTLQYLRVEYAGTEFSPDNELNGIAFQGVGSGTIVDHVQVHFNQDDGVEFFGGTVNVRYILITNARDDSFDWTEGWTGKGQFLLAQQNGEEADNGFEGDNNAENNNLTPRAAPMLFNYTLLGDPDSLEGTESDDGMLIREGTAGTFRNFIVTGFKETGLNVDHDATIAEAQSGALSFNNAIFFNNGTEFDADSAPFVADKNIEVINPMLIDPFNLQFPDFRPAAGSPALDAKRVQLPPDDGFFDTSVNFIGAVDPLDDWTRGWTTAQPN